MDLIDAPNATAVTAIQAGLSTFAAGDTVARVTLVDTTTTNTDMRGTDNAPTVAQIDTELSSTHGDDSWMTVDNGLGATAVTVTVTDGTDPIKDIGVTIRNTAGTVISAGPLATDVDGEAIFYLADGDYLALPQSRYLYTGGSTALTVASTPLAVTCEMTVALIPASTSPDLCAVYTYLRDAQGNLLGDGVGSMTVKGVPTTTPAVSGTSVIGHATTDTATTNSAGLVELELIRGEEYTIEVIDGLASTLLTVTVPDAASYNITEELG